MISYVNGSFVIYAVRPTDDVPLPDVYIPQGVILFTNVNNYDLAVDGSPINKILISCLKFPHFWF